MERLQREDLFNKQRIHTHLYIVAIVFKAILTRHNSFANK